MRRLAALALALSVMALSACALLSKGERSVPRYFNPEIPTKTTAREGNPAGLALRLGRVTSAAHLGERIVFRESEYELGYYEDRLWTERPVAYLRRALNRILFEEEGLQSAVSGRAPTLDVELLSFEEVMEPRHIAVIRLAFSLQDTTSVRRQQTLTVERPIAPAALTASPDALAQALGDALRGAVTEVAALVAGDLRQMQEPSTQGPGAEN